MLLLSFYSFQKRRIEEDLSEELTTKRTRIDNKDPPGEEISEEEGWESEAEATNINAADTSTTESSSSSKQATRFSRK